VRYATEDNFMEEQLYPVAKVVLRKPAVESLSEAQEDLKERGLELEVFDGYRPYRVTEKMWEPYQDPDFVADPAEGSRHNRGCAVDVTLVDSANGEELLMPTDYDDLTEKAAHDYVVLPEEAIRPQSCDRHCRTLSSPSSDTVKVILYVAEIPVKG
jgi:zinc D-Ala-D-Ala dipeptidase